MSDASVRTIGHDDEASLWTTTSHSTIGIDHLKQKGPKWYDIDKRRCGEFGPLMTCLLYTSPSPRDGLLSRMPSSA